MVIDHYVMVAKSIFGVHPALPQYSTYSRPGSLNWPTRNWTYIKPLFRTTDQLCSDFHPELGILLPRRGGQLPVLSCSCREWEQLLGLDSEAADASLRIIYQVSGRSSQIVDSSKVGSSSTYQWI